MEQRKALVVPVSLLCQDPWWAGVGRVCSGHRLSFWVLPQMLTVHGSGRGLLSQGGMCWAQANCSSSTSGSIPFSARGPSAVTSPWQGPGLWAKLCPRKYIHWQLKPGETSRELVRGSGMLFSSLPSPKDGSRGRSLRPQIQNPSGEGQTTPQMDQRLMGNECALPRV